MNRKTLFLLIAALLVTVLVFAGCVAQEPTPTEPPTDPPATTAPPTDPPTDPPTAPPTEPPTEPPTDPPPTNPLTGEVLEAPLENRIVAVTINNVKPALPHIGVNEADLYFEMYVNNYVTRGLALFTNIEELAKIGSVRSLRQNFTDIGVGYDAIVCNSGCSDTVRTDARNAGVAQMNIESGNLQPSFRDKDRRNSGYALEHTLFLDGTKVYAAAADRGFRTTFNQEKDYSLVFSQESGAVSGEDASTLSITFRLSGYEKKSTFHYDQTTGRYLFSQYGMEMIDGATGERESFRNVIVIFASISNKRVGDTIYHIANLEGSGSGYLACNGKIVPITWSRPGPSAAFSFTLADGSPAALGVGSSYIAIAPNKSPVSWE